MLKKSLVIATLGTAVASMSFAGKADAADPVLGALVGGGIGAAIGHQVNHHNGAAVGGVLGAVVGSSIAASSNYYGDPYYAPSAPYAAPAYGAYPAPAYGYYAPPPPVYYAPPAYSVVYSSGPYYGHGRHGHHGHNQGYRYR